MYRTERTTVWDPDDDDAVFTVDIDGTQRDAITTDNGEHIGTTLSGDRVTFEFNFPQSDVDAKTVFETLLTIDTFESGPQGQENRSIVYDMEYDGAFDIGRENEHKLVVHPKRNCSADTMRTIYQNIQNSTGSHVQVIRYWYEL